MIEITLPKSVAVEATDIVHHTGTVAVWEEPDPGKRMFIRMVLSTRETERVLDLLESKYANLEGEGFSAAMVAVETVLPRAQAEPKEKADVAGGDEKTPLRVSRQELYTEIEESSSFTSVFVTMVILSTIVAAIGLLRDNVAVVIGAMVIAPLLGPNVALALATALGDLKLGLESLKTNFFGIFIAFVMAVSMGMLIEVDPTTPEIASRTTVDLTDIALAIASGCAGTLAFTTGASATLIGVMVAVALLPPLVTFGLLLGGQYYPEAVGALLLLLTNLICVNLAGVSTFLIQGIRPRRWWTASTARKASSIAITLWSIMLIALAVVIYLSRGRLF